jgi:hypothetical protein
MTPHLEPDLGFLPGPITYNSVTLGKSHCDLPESIPSSMGTAMFSNSQAWEEALIVTQFERATVTTWPIGR